MLIPKRFSKLEERALEIVKNNPRQLGDLARLLSPNNLNNGKIIVFRLVSFGILTRDRNDLIALSPNAKGGADAASVAQP